MANKYFHFTLGPVQGFVAQARRTRDFWAGSFLLSWLSGTAMIAVQKQGGNIQFPIPAKDYLGWLEGNGKGHPPEQGAIPNRFKVMSAEVPEDFDPQRVVETIQAAWRALAEQIWEKDILGITSDLTETRKIWDRQISQFWEISWYLTDKPEASNLLDRRKNWRNYHPPEEAGVKCMMMDGWQELSGVECPGRSGQGERPFWQALRERVGSTDLKPKEELCAIAFVKRRFSHVFAKLSAPMPGGWMLKGWKVPVNVPSVSYLAAAHWLADSIRNTGNDHQADALWDFQEKLAERNGRGYRAEIPLCVEEALKGNPYYRDAKEWQLLDGQYLFDFIVNREEPDDTELQDNLRDIQKITNTRPSPYYAVLLMDGDSLGSQMSDPDKQKPISKALNQFTDKVPTVVRQHSGFLVYAGGDDVLALLPLEDAMNCALALRNHYQQCFEQQAAVNGKKITSTLSGAIEYCHIKSPLMKGLSDAHDLLDNIGKDQTGRDALAIRVWKPGGLHLQWSCPWEKALSENGSDKLAIDQLADDICDALQEETEHFAWGFFQKATELFRELQLDKEEQVLEPEIITSLLKSAWRHSGLDNKRADSTVELCDRLVAVCQQWQRMVLKDGVATFEKKPGYSPDALKLIRFLVTKGQDKEGQRL
ncbi:type III-B CRISPR-associated protein Cas10/Cmr2 [Endozoicomonas sp.]|uniref:type III-B CRISPR-associated protein Cas10/Cmr2 n=1 Tax=Endozoicomonas sp. TaxID=1892382 RepID=UPI002886815B|nr:type III-B CRISPR-associated protein Cas10/Cmr2 [Endozoicomonas sp.]